MSPRALLLPVLLLAACSTPGRNVPVNLPPAPGPTPREQVTAEVGRLLSADPVASAEAERRLRLLDEKGRAALAQVAKTLPRERDPRWLHVLDENQMLPVLTDEEFLAFLHWKAGRPEELVAAKAQSRLLDLARAKPSLLVRALERRRDLSLPADESTSVEALAVAVAMAKVREAVPALLALYRRPRLPQDRRAAAEALGILTDGAVRLRHDGNPAQIEKAAREVDAWLATDVRDA
jgi:hypothetical protein